jgi:hypothetical protein
VSKVSELTEPQMRALKGELEGTADRLDGYTGEVMSLAGRCGQVNGIGHKHAQLVVDLRDAIAKCDALWPTDRGREVLADAH